MNNYNKMLDNTVEYDSTSIIEHAGDLLCLITLIRQEKYHIIQEKFYRLVVKEVDELTGSLQKFNFTTDEINKAVYFICAGIDEALLTTGNNTMQSLGYKSFIGYYFNEEFSGENFFKMLDELRIDMAKNLPLVSLGYLIINLGFEGKYAISGTEKQSLIEMKNQIYITQPRASALLFIEDKKKTNKFVRIKDFVNFKMISLILTLLLSIYIFLLFALLYQKEQLHELIMKQYL